MRIFELTTVSLVAVFTGIQFYKGSVAIANSTTTEQSTYPESTQIQKKQDSIKRISTEPIIGTSRSTSSKSASDVKTSTTETQHDLVTSSTTNLTLEQFNRLAAQELALLILNENAAANHGRANLVIDTNRKDIALAQTECEFTNQQQKMIHNFIPAPGGQNIAGGTYQAAVTTAGAQLLAKQLFEGYVSEKTGYHYLLAAGYTPEEIVSGGAQITVGNVTYSAKGMSGTGFETSSQGGVVSHYAEIANQVPSHKATKFAVSVVYNPQSQFVSTAADFFCGDVQNVYQMNDQGNMGYVTY
jgi:hypothetical protein